MKILEKLALDNELERRQKRLKNINFVDNVNNFDSNYFDDHYNLKKNSNYEALELEKKLSFLNIGELHLLSKKTKCEKLKEFCSSAINEKVERNLSFIVINHTCAENALKNFIKNKLNKSVSYIETKDKDENNPEIKKQREFYYEGHFMFKVRLSENNYPISIIVDNEQMVSNGHNSFELTNPILDLNISIKDGLVKNKKKPKLNL